MRPIAEPAPSEIGGTRISLVHPVVVFVLLSMTFGIIIIAITAPLRGPDEAAHFLRAYGMAQGDLIPSQVDVRGRKGVFLPAGLHREFAVFEAAHAKERRIHWSREAKSESQTNDSVTGNDGQTVFAAYEGSEGYTPIVYFPHVAAAFVARVASLDFVATISLMRLTGLAATTAVIAYAVWILPCFRWAFVSIAMLPAALYSRAVISADGVTLAFALTVIAVALQSASHTGVTSRLQPALWITLAALSKPPIFILAALSLLRVAPRELLRYRYALALPVVPGIIAMIAWTAATAGDVAAWRLAELTGRAAEQFDPAWKLRFMLEHPMRFPMTVITTFRDVGELWRQMIGVLGLFDTVLQPWAYPAITLLLVAASLTPVDRGAATRHWLAVVAGVTAGAYILAVFLIFYLVWTPTDADQVWGVQGRYFIPCLPLVAIICCSINRGLGEQTRASAAIAGATLSGIATAEAILRVDWNIWGT
jgi:uncharacterized membrane protein